VLTDSTAITRRLRAIHYTADTFAYCKARDVLW
jgi:hypothetical protein